MSFIRIRHPCDQPRSETDELAEFERLSMFEAWDMIAGRTAPELGGSADLLDVVGVNFYPSNQWTIEDVRVGLGELRYRPFRQILAEVSDRYDRPIVIAETGAEEPNGQCLLAYVGSEARAAMAEGVQLEGLCVYPIMDYPGWTDGRHCRCGLIEFSADWQRLRLREEMASSLADLGRHTRRHALASDRTVRLVAGQAR